MTTTIRMKHVRRTAIMAKYFVMRVWASSRGSRGSEVADCGVCGFTVCPDVPGPSRVRPCTVDGAGQEL